MPTTTRSSEPAPCRRDVAGGRPGALAAGALLLGLGACATRQPAELFRLPPTSPEHRAAQTRWFETRDANELMSASAAVLQDLGFHLEEVTRELGFLRASKERSGRETGQELGRAFLMLLSFGYSKVPVDLQQKIAASLVVRPLDQECKRQEVRIMFYRVVWAGDGYFSREYVPPGEQRIEMIRDAAIYQQFFAKLSKAVFLEAYTL